MSPFGPKENEELTPKRVKVLLYLATTKRKKRLDSLKAVARYLGLGSPNTVGTAYEMFLRSGYVKLAEKKQTESSFDKVTDANELEVTREGRKQLEPLLNVIGMRNSIILTVLTLIFGGLINTFFVLFSFSHNALAFLTVVILSIIPYALFYYFKATSAKKTQTEKLLALLTEPEQES